MLDETGLLYLLQVAGASFPTGAFAHSLGFETLVDEGSVVTAAELEEVAGDWLELSLGPMDGSACALAHRAAAAGPRGDDELLAIDELLDALKPAREAHEASVKVGTAFMRAVGPVGGGRALARYASAMAEGRAAGHSAPAFALACVDAGVSREMAVLAYLQSSFANLVLVVARLVPLGQVETQQVVADVRPRLLEASEKALAATADDLAAATPWLDIAVMRHERLYTRLCIS